MILAAGLGTRLRPLSELCAKPAMPIRGIPVIAHTLTWLESGDFDQRQTSLNGEQSHVDPDGRVRIVLAHTDPGVPNWLDTEGRRRGMLIYRWVWSRDAPTPVARVVKPENVRELLPDDHPVVTPDERRRRLSQRRAQAWSRLR